jgi:hypothetical protein
VISDVFPCRLARHIEEGHILFYSYTFSTPSTVRSHAFRHYSNTPLHPSYPPWLKKKIAIKNIGVMIDMSNTI